MRIRRMEERDVPQVSALENRCFSRPWGEKELLSSLQKDFYVFFAAEEAPAAADPETDREPGRIIGYISMYTVLDEGDITEVAVDEAYRRGGIGSALLEALIRYAKETGLQTLTLEVRAGNVPAMSLYEKYGFREIGLRKRYYEDPEEDARIYALALD